MSHGIQGISHRGAGIIQEALFAAYVGPDAAQTTLVPSPGPGGLVTTSFDADGPVANYNSLTWMVRWGLPAAFLLGVGTCAAAVYFRGR